MLAHSSEREKSDSEGDASKVETEKRKHSIEPKLRGFRAEDAMRDLFCEQKSMMT